MDSSEQRTKLIELIGLPEYQRLEGMIPPKYNFTIDVNFSNYLIEKSESDILSFYSGMINNNEQWSTTKLCGSIIILTSHVHDLLVKLVESREDDTSILSLIKKLDLHNLILFCSSRYNIPKDYFVHMMKLKHFRNVIAHDFNKVLEASFHEVIEPIGSGNLLVVVLTKMVREVKDEQK